MNQPSGDERYLTAAQAAAELGVSVPTLYAYVSRGLLRSEAGAGGGRTRRYRAEDVDRLRQRALQRREPERAAATALDWGAPVLESQLTLIEGGRLFYRGRDAVALSSEGSFEEVAALLWTDSAEQGRALFPPARLPLPEAARKLLPEVASLSPLDRVQALLPVLATEDPGAYVFRPGNVSVAAAQLLRWVAAIVTEQGEAQSSIVETLCHGWKAERSAPSLLNAALILCTDHELNASSFTARCVAGAGGTLYGAVTAGLAALQGVRHGGATERVKALFQEAAQPENAGRTVEARLRRGDGLPGFGHRLYPQGDPRAEALLALLEAECAGSPALDLARSLRREVFQTLGEHPTIDFALVTLARVLELAPGSALAVFAVGRTAGLLAHAIEQYGMDQLLRPRARYTGRAASG